jgi:hypothetical protein
MFCGQKLDDTRYSSRITFLQLRSRLFVFLTEFGFREEGACDADLVEAGAARLAIENLFPAAFRGIVMIALIFVNVLTAPFFPPRVGVRP